MSDVKVHRFTRNTTNAASTKEIKMTTIKEVQVTYQGIPADQIDLFSSDKAVRAIYKGAIFGATQSLMTHAGKLHKFNQFIQRLEEQGMKTKVDEIKVSPRYQDTEKRAYDAAQRLAVLHAKSDAKGLDIELELLPTLQRASTQDQINKKAEFAKVKPEYVLEIERKQIQSNYDAAMTAMSLATELFFSVETEIEVNETDEHGQITGTSMQDIECFFNPNAVLKNVTSTRDWLLGWNNPDWAELGILSNDIDTAESALAKFQMMEEGGYEGSRIIDDSSATSQDMTQGVTE